jgi:hypothetical protein
VKKIFRLALPGKDGDTSADETPDSPRHVTRERELVAA